MRPADSPVFRLNCGFATNAPLLIDVMMVSTDVSFGRFAVGRVVSYESSGNSLYNGITVHVRARPAAALLHRRVHILAG